MLEAGALVGDRYRVGRTLGKGGMGVVVEATHLQLGTNVAIKVLKQDSADAANIERFMREARAAAKLRGEHICRVHDFGTLPDGAPYMVMELLSGQDLATVLKASGPIEEGLLARYMLEICAAIAEAHSAGIIHRDLKPGNLYVVERLDGVQVMKVLDFGIAKSIEKKDFALTDTTNVMGSPAYMSPEQLKSSKSVDTRSDIWSLGVVMYEMVIGQHPFTGESLTELAISIANDPLPPFPASVSPAIAAVIIKCLEKDVGKRYQDVAALAAALEPLAKRTASVAGSIKRTLTTGSVAAVADGPKTEPALPHHLASPELTAKLANGGGLARAISEVADAKETTTLRGASGVVVAQSGERTLPRRRWLVPAIGAAFAAVAIFVGVTQFGGSRDEPSNAPAQPSAQPAPTPVAAPIADPPPAPAPAPAPTAVDPSPVPATPTDVPPPAAAVVEPAVEPADPVKPVTKKKATKKPSRPRDLSKSRY